MNYLYSIIISVLVLSSASIVDAKPGGAHDRHQAMYLVNLVRNIDWGNNNVTIGVFGDSPVKSELEALVQRNAKIQVKQLEDFSNVGECDIVFLPDASNRDFFVAQNEIADSPILLVVDKKPLVVRGAEIGFYLEEDKLKIAINPKEIEKTGIKISHTLMEKAATFF